MPQTMLFRSFQQKVAFSSTGRGSSTAHFPPAFHQGSYPVKHITSALNEATISPAVVTDSTVPEGHKGLHGYLYGEDGAEGAHGSNNYEFREGEDDGSATISATAYVQNRENEKPVGVYAIFDAKRNIQYVGYSRNMVLSVKGHLTRVGEDRCAFVRTMVFQNKAMSSRANLEREAQNWLEEYGTLPPGNGVERDEWEGSSGPSVSNMSEAELADYEARKLKMQKAMGENLADGAAGESEGTRDRRLAMMMAVEGDDWSTVIDGQTRETVDPAKLAAVEAKRAAVGGASSSGDSSSSSGEAVVSPFTRASVHRSVGSSGPAPTPPALSVEAVDAALDEVRPYLMADGGDVAVVGVENGVVALQFMGNCSTCPSQGATLKMGIERALMSKFGELIKEIVQVNPAIPGASVQAIDMHLNMLRGAVSGLGGSVEVVKVEGGVCELRYNGPPAIGKGLAGAVRDQFPDLREVKLVP